MNIDDRILPVDSYNKLSEMSEEIRDSLSKRQIFRTETEARVSVLDNIHFPTKASKYWQCVREQVVMVDQLTLLSFEYRRNEINISKNNRLLSLFTDDFDKALLKVDLDEQLYKRNSMLDIAKDRFREIEMWSKLKSELDDGTFDTNNVDTHQLISYTTQFALAAATLDSTKVGSDEMVNMAALLQTAMNRCKEVGVLDQVLSSIPSSVSNKLQLENF